jgi:hypothetical protein
MGSRLEARPAAQHHAGKVGELPKLRQAVAHSRDSSKRDAAFSPNKGQKRFWKSFHIRSEN